MVCSWSMVSARGVGRGKSYSGLGQGRGLAQRSARYMPHWSRDQSWMARSGWRSGWLRIQRSEMLGWRRARAQARRKGRQGLECSCEALTVCVDSAREAE